MPQSNRFRQVNCPITGCEGKTLQREGHALEPCMRCMEELDALGYPTGKGWPDESRIDTIGPNGNDGLHYGAATVTAGQILEAAAGHMQDRAVTYDKPEGERSMGATVQAFAAVTGVTLTEEQGWLFMTLLKAVRSQQGAYRADSYEDGTAYFSLAGESAARDRGQS